MIRRTPPSARRRRRSSAVGDPLDGGAVVDHAAVRIRDRGAASSLTVVLLTPVMIVLGFAAFQAAMWGHARTEARVVARDTAALVGRAGVPPGDARDSAEAVLAADTLLRDVVVEVDVGTSLVTVTVRGAAPGIIRGTWASVDVVAAVPIEGWVP